MKRRKTRARFGRGLALAGTVVALLLTTSAARADTLLRWYPPGDPDLAGYRLYLTGTSMQYDLDAVVDLGAIAPVAGIVTVDAAPHMGAADRFAVVTAYDDSGNESPFSAEDALTVTGGGECLVDADCSSPETCAEPARCEAGVCVAGDPLSCPEPGSCEMSTCAETGSCTTAARPDGSACDDGDPLSLGDVCLAGVCTGFECLADADCAGTNPDACRETAICDAGTCRAGAPLSCPAPGQCEVSTCGLTGGCSVEPLPDGTACEDGDETTLGDQCGAGVCVPGEADPFAACRGTVGDPDLVRLTWHDDAATSAIALWTAPFVEAGSAVRFHRVGESDWLEAAGEPTAVFGCTAHYAAVLEGLEPGGRYEYTASGAGPLVTPWSELATFRTAEIDLPSRWQYFAFLGSVGLHGVGGARSADVFHHLLQRRVSFVLGGGDYANTDDAIAEGAAATAYDALVQWFAQAGDVLRRAPFLPVYGDRELARALAGDDFMGQVHPTFGEHGSYSFDADGTHFVALDAPDPSTLSPGTAEGDAHLEWLDADLSRARTLGARFIIVYMHTDVYSSEAGHSTPPGVRSALDAIFQRHDVRLVLSAGGASYERSHPLRSGTVSHHGQVVHPRDGVVYIRAGSSGWSGTASFAPGPPPDWSAVRDATDRSAILVREHAYGLLVWRVAFDEDGARIADVLVLQ